MELLAGLQGADILCGETVTHLPIVRIKRGGTEWGCAGFRAWGELRSPLSPPTVVTTAATKTRSDRQELASS